MKRAEKARSAWLFVGIFTSVSAVAAIPVIVLAALNGLYFLMAVAIAIVAHGFYGVTFYFIAFVNSCVRIRCIRAVEDGQIKYSSIARYALIKENAAVDAISLCIKKGYIEGFSMSDDGLVPVRSELADAAIKCEYCGNTVCGGESCCPTCGALLNSENI